MSSFEGYCADILIVDDTPTNLELLSGILMRKSYRVRVATNGQRALAAVASCHPDLIMLDINMPRMNGYEVCRTLKNDPLTVHIPVIFISALDEAVDKVKAFQAGGVDYVTKPFQMEEVLARIENHLKISRLQKEMEHKNAELAQANRQLEQANRLLESLSLIDELTKLANRRHFDQYLDQEWRRAIRDGTPLSLVMIDIDHFKLLNDCYGHPVGDECLRKVAATLRDALRRASDLAARYGGEEFAVILPRADEVGARTIAEDLRARIESLHIPHERSPFHIVTVSLGVATVRPSDNGDPERLIQTADQMLYQSKHSGRNRVSYPVESTSAVI